MREERQSRIVPADRSGRIPASNDWKSITFDLTAGKAQVLQNFPNAGKKGDRLRFDINNINGTPLYIRAIRLHKK